MEEGEEEGDPIDFESSLEQHALQNAAAADAHLINLVREFSLRSAADLAFDLQMTFAIQLDFQLHVDG